MKYLVLCGTSAVLAHLVVAWILSQIHDGGNFVVQGLFLNHQKHNTPKTRRDALTWLVQTGVTTAGLTLTPTDRDQAKAVGQLSQPIDVDRFLSSGRSVSPSGISGQASKSRPETGIRLREGSEPERDTRTGDVSAEILLQSSGSSNVPVMISFRSEKWPLATGSIFDVECRDANSGDSAFLAVTPNTNGKSLAELDDSFVVDAVFSPFGRFSAYGEPTDVRVNGSEKKGNYQILDVSFSTLSQSTQTELPRHAKLVATIPKGTNQAVILVGSSSASRWKKGSDNLISKIGESFRAIPAPSSEMKARVVPRPVWKPCNDPIC